MTPSRILVIGAGGREHALAWRLARDPHAPTVFVAPGNDGIAEAFACLPVPEHDGPGLVAACREHRIDLAVVGPEAPLAAGVADTLRAAGIAVFGPSREAARLESSKWFAKEVMQAAGVPTARARRFTTVHEAQAALAGGEPPFVLKADGLAAGKGVLVTPDRAEALRFAADCLEGGRFGDGGRSLVIEEHLAGEEASVIAVCDGERHVLLPPARDYKRAHDDDHGANTGGMGSYAPSAAVGPAVEREVSERVVTPVLREMARRGTPFRGALYCGLMLTAGGAKVIEFNVRFGDPETQSILPLVEGSLATLLASAAAGPLDAGAVQRSPGAAVSVVIADETYPEAVRGGGVIEGLDALADVLVFHAGTRREHGRWVVRGGRAACLTAVAESPGAARAKVYAARERLAGSGWRTRSDVAAARSGAAEAAGAGR